MMNLKMRITKTDTKKRVETILLKIHFTSLGILLTIFFYNQVLPLMLLWWFAFITTGIYFIIQLIYKYKKYDFKFNK